MAKWHWVLWSKDVSNYSFYGGWFGFSEKSTDLITQCHFILKDVLLPFPSHLFTFLSYALLKLCVGHPHVSVHSRFGYLCWLTLYRHVISAQSSCMMLNCPDVDEPCWADNRSVAIRHFSMVAGVRTYLFVPLKRRIRQAQRGSLVMIRAFWTLGWFNLQNKMNSRLAEPTETSNHLRLV